jgi:hypothetical protein
MFKDAEAMWSSVGGGDTSSPVSAVTMLQKREVISGSGIEHPGLHAAGSPRQGSETPSCSGPAHNNHGDAGCCVSFIYR